jgi:protein-disulfide isomerase
LKIHLPSIGIGVGAVIGVAVVVFLIYGQGFEKPTAQTPQEGNSLDTATQQSSTTPQATMKLLVDNASPMLGSKDAPITMIEFGDYQCFYCNKFYHTIEPDIVKNYIDTGKVRMVFKDFVIIGQDSVNAAHAAHCAQEQGKFWEYHDTLYNNWSGENTGWASSSNLLSFAKKIGLDGDQFSQCMAQSKYISVVQGSLSNAKDLGLTGTPDFFIITPDHSITKIVGAQPYEVFDNIFKSKLSS